MYYSSESSDSENINDNASLDLSHLSLDIQSMSLHLQNSVVEQRNHKFLKPKSNRPKTVDPQTKEELFDDITEKIFIQYNSLQFLPFEITLFTNLKVLDLSNNNLSQLNEFLNTLIHLQSLYLKNNELLDDSFPKSMAALVSLKELNLSGNNLSRIPPQIFELTSLKYLYIGNNRITAIQSQIKNLKNLQMLHLGGNYLKTVPEELGLLSHLSVLALCDNSLKKLPIAISKLTKLKSLLLHKNNLCCLPVEIVKLRSLNEISLRDNPLVHKFVDCCAKEIINTPPSLLELAARVIKVKNVSYDKEDIPIVLDKYINSGKKCVNPTCKGVYFSSCVAHIKFIDFCGKYRLPLMHYLCSTRCSSTTPASYKTRRDSESDEEDANQTLKKVLLG